MQLDVGSEPTLSFANVTSIILDMKPPKSNGSKDINFYLVIFGPMNYFLVPDR